MAIEHSAAPTGEIHPVCNWNYPNTAARTGASGFIAEDIGKAAWQQDDDSFWILKAAAPPTWVPFGGSIPGAIAALVATAPATLDTLNELAIALGNDANFATTITAALAGKAATVHTHPGVYEPADPTIAKTGAGQTFTKPQIAGILALTSGAAWDGSLATGKQHLTANVNGGVFTVVNPSAHANGAMYMIVVTYATAHGVAWDSMFKGTAAFTPTATAGATDIFYFRSNGTELIRAGYALNGGA